jgi:hypothetical protein
MLRRVTRTSVCVFLAARFPYRVRLELFNTPQPSATPIASTEAVLHPVGPRLHLAAIELQLTEPLPTGVLHYYNLRFIPTTDPAAPGGDLADLGLLASGAISYGGQLPSFALAPSLAGLNLVHGSCRRPGGQGIDALTLVERHLADNHANASARPHQLVLTGDQIYADDVDLSLAMTLRETAGLLVGNDERLVHENLRLALDDAPVAPGHRRAFFVSDTTGLTTGDNQGHLLFLGEFFAMYLMAFSDALWPSVPDPEDPTKKLFRLSYPLEPDDENGFKKEVRASRRRTLAFAASLRNVRRLFANVPTCMIFDDHEVSDDWYCNREWRDTVRNHRLGRQLLRNALVAYALFQDWGNQPQNYQPGALGRQLLDAVQWPPADAPPPVAKIHQTPALLDQVLDIGATSPESPDEPSSPPLTGRMRWDYFLDGEGYRLLVLDTRTYRYFPKRPEVLPHVQIDPQQPSVELEEVHLRKISPGLMTAEAMQAQIRERRDPNRFHIVVSPAPVLAVPAAEALLSLIGSFFPKIGPEKTDREAWAARAASHHALLRELGRLGPSVVVLSGDVHHAFSFTMSYYDKANGGPDPEQQVRARSRIVQLCSSGLKYQGELPLVPAFLDEQPGKILGIIPESDEHEKARQLYVLLSNAIANAREAGNFGHPQRMMEALRAQLVLNAATYLDELPLQFHTHLLQENPIFAEPANLVSQLGADRRYMVEPLVQPQASGGSEPGPFGINRWLHSKIVGINNVGFVKFWGTPSEPLRVEHALRYFDIATQFPVLQEVTGPDGGYLEFSLGLGEFVMAESAGTTTHTASLQRPTAEEV